jgi:hypothetical protein
VPSPNRRTTDLRRSRVIVPSMCDAEPGIQRSMISAMRCAWATDTQKISVGRCRRSPIDLAQPLCAVAVVAELDQRFLRQPVRDLDRGVGHAVQRLLEHHRRF